MNIGLVTTYFHPFNIGGAELSTFYLGKALVEKRHKVVIITYNYGAAPFERLEGMDVYRIPFPQHFNMPSNIKGRYLYNPFLHIFSLFKIAKIIIREKLDVLHIQSSNLIEVCFWAAKIFKLVSVITIRDYSLLCGVGFICAMEDNKYEFGCGLMKYLHCLKKSMQLYLSRNLFFPRTKFFLVGLFRYVDTKIKKHYVSRFDKIIMVGENLKKIYLERNFSEWQHKIKVIYNIPPLIDNLIKREENFFIKYGLKDEMKIVVCVGKASYGKGTKYLSDAIPLVLEKYSTAHFLFLGRDTDKIRFSNEIDKSKIQSLGIISNQETLKIIAHAYLVVIPSLWEEPFSRVLLEAMALEKPIIATKAGGNSEAIIDGVNGFLVEKRNTGELADRIITLLNNESLARNMGMAGSRFLEAHFSKDKIIEDLIDTVYLKN